MFDQYFDKFQFRLQLEHRVADVRESVGESTALYPLEEYCSTLIKC